MNFGDKLRQLREAKGWSQKELAIRSDCSQTAIANWEQGRREPAFGAVQRICASLGLDCRIFDGCDFGEAVKKPGRGRPVKEDTPKKGKKKS